MCVDTGNMAYERRSKDNFWESVLLFSCGCPHLQSGARTCPESAFT